MNFIGLQSKISGNYNKADKSASTS